MYFFNKNIKSITYSILNHRYTFTSSTKTWPSMGNRSHMCCLASIVQLTPHLVMTKSSKLKLHQSQHHMESCQPTAHPEPSLVEHCWMQQQLSENTLKWWCSWSEHLYHQVSLCFTSLFHDSHLIEIQLQAYKAVLAIQPSRLTTATTLKMMVLLLCSPPCQVACTTIQTRAGFEGNSWRRRVCWGNDFISNHLWVDPRLGIQ